MSKTIKMPEAHYRELSTLADSYWWHWTRRQLVLQWAKKNIERTREQYGTLIDVGCGTGLGTNLVERDLQDSGLTTKDFEAYGMDHPSVASIHQLKRAKNFRAVDFDSSSQVEMPRSKNGIGLVTCLDVLEHVKDSTRLVSSIAEGMDAHDIAVFTVPAYRFLWSKWDVKLGHLRRYTKNQLRSELEEAGMTVLKSGYLFSWAVLPGVLRAKRQTKAEGAEFPIVPKWMNQALKLTGIVEVAAGKVFGIPFGTSAWAVARRNLIPR